MVDIERPTHTKENERTIVYHGTGMSGRTTNLMDIASQLPHATFHTFGVGTLQPQPQGRIVHVTVRAFVRSVAGFPSAIPFSIGV